MVVTLERSVSNPTNLLNLRFPSVPNYGTNNLSLKLTLINTHQTPTSPKKVTFRPEMDCYADTWYPTLHRWSGTDKRVEMI